MSLTFYSKIKVFLKIFFKYNIITLLKVPKFELKSRKIDQIESNFLFKNQGLFKNIFST